ncbi:MAG: class I mannose-6-phosphate isomerase [Rikenellaceae bacterium]|nr:class I mannose-6-phosphate isomerase [Rikenellaceae bacterium]
MLYPLKFKPLYKERIWGGRRMEAAFGKKLPAGKKIGESWELSGVQGDVSVVSNGKLAGNDIEELVEVYMGDLVGDAVYERFGQEFPLLIKFIDAADILSIQVHPDDDLAAERHNAYGKTEMWYVLDSDPGAELCVGFNRKVSRQEYLESVEAGSLPELLSRIKVKPGDAYFIPAGTIHAIGKGLMVAEIQQTSDITYRVFDWNRVDDKGNPRQLHTELAVDAINFADTDNYNVTVSPKAGEAAMMQSCKYFASSVLAVDGAMTRPYVELDSFVIYICLEGSADVVWSGGRESVTKGETMLVPAVIDEVTLEGNAKIIEVYIPGQQ